jgi:two-component system response regulator FixJ
LAKVVYIVDDDDAVRDSLQGLLEQRSFETEAFASGRDFLKRYKPDFEGCLILDINMPELDGFEVLGRLGPPRTALPVIMITAQDDQSIESRALDAGATALIRKPFVAKRLLALVGAAVERRAVAR